MKYSFKARMEAHDNRRKIIDDNVHGAINAIEKTIDEAIKIGEFECVVSLDSFLKHFEEEIKAEINNNLSIYGYKIEWCECDDRAIVSFEEG